MTERDIANNAKTKLKGSLISKIGSQLKERTGDSKRDTDVRSRFSGEELAKLVIRAPRYIFIQNYGFEGVKKNGINMRLQAKRTIDQAIEESNIMDYLADNISEIRADKVIAEFTSR